MSKKFLSIIGLIFIAANAAAAQTHVVTNEDLEKYRQKRVAAERDLRENYERLGFPSPAEMQQQNERNAVERSALAARLESEKAQRDQLNLERERAAAESRSRNQQYQTPLYPNYQNNYPSNYGYSNYGSGGFLSFPNYGGGYYNQGGNGGFYGNFGGGRRGNYNNYNNQPRVEYRNNLPVILPPAPRRILAPGQSGGGRRRN